MRHSVRSPWLKKLVLSLSGKQLANEFEKASHNVRQTQESILKRVIDSCRDTVFGREHGFGKIRSIMDYRRAVPVRDFEGHRAYVERMTKGEDNVLFPGKPLFYNTTSGTASKPKMIPVSQEYFRKAHIKLSRLWLYSCLRDNPRMFNGKNLASAGAAEEGKTDDGTPYGSLSGAVYRNAPSVIKHLYSMPYSVICIKDYRKKYYAMMRCALASDIAYIVVTNPSSLLKFHEVVMDNLQDLIRDIRNGSLREDVASEIPEDERGVILDKFVPDAARANFLEGIANQNGDALRPKHYWLNLVCINTWKQGNCAQILPKLAGYFSESTVIREFGYMASEARGGIVLENDWSSSALSINTYHFEFIEESERNSENPIALLAHELEVGKRYYILITNTSGLYRYDINDIIEVTGFYNQVPLFDFIRKGDGFTSLTGEKLTETQVIEAMERTGRILDVQFEYFTMCCDEKNLCYRLFVEFSNGTPGEKRRIFEEEIDCRLAEINPEYESKRGSGRLPAPVLIELPARSYERVKDTLVACGMVSEGQYKTMYLQRKPQLLAVLEDISRQF